MTNLTADYLPKSAQNSETDTTLPTTTQTYDKVEQPLLYDYGLHVSATGTRDGNTWVNKTVAKGIFGQDYPGHTLDTIFGSKTGIITSHPDKYFFAAYVDFSESYHRVILLARSQDPSDKNLYSYTIHTYTQNNSTTTTKPGDSTKEQYTGTGRSTHDLIFQNYDGDSFSVKLNGFKEGQEYGLLPVFDGGLLDPTYGSNTYDQNNKAAETKSIGFWASAIPQKTSTEVRYVDQATGKDIVQPMEISGFGYQGFKVKGEAPTVTGYQLVSKPEFLSSKYKASAYEDGTISPYKVGQTYDLALSDSVVIKQTVIDTNGTVRATPYYNGSPLTNASKVLGRESYNDHMSFSTPDGKFHTYTNRIGQVGDSYIYYYAKDSDPKGSEMRLHFIDVTGVNNSYYAPSDGPELDVDKVQTIHGNIGENYSFTYTVPTNYYEVGSSDVTGTYSGTHHDAYIYVKIDRNGAKDTIENLTYLNHAQKQAAEAAIDQATDLNTMNQAISTATTLDGDMGKLSDLTADLTNTNNYKYASDKPKSTVAADYTNADVLFDKDDKTAGQNADDATVLKLIDQINTHKSSLDGDTNLSAAETTISGLTHLNDAQRSAANQAVTNASDLTGLKTAVGNAQSVDSAMSDLQTAVNKANEAKTTNNYLQASADKQGNLNSAVQNAQAVLAATGANDSANQVKDLTKSVNDAVDALDGDANTKKQADQKIDDVAKAAKQAIDNTKGLTDSEKEAAKSQVDTDAKAAKGAIDKADSKDAVTDAVNNGTVAIDKVSANAAIDGALAEKNNSIDAAPNLTAEEKKAVKDQAQTAATNAKTAISKASTVGDVTTAQTNGEKAINAVEIPTSSKTKNDANSALDTAADAAKKAIDATSGLTADQKKTAKDQIDQAVTAAKDNINKASDDTGVAAATDAGKLAIDKVSANAAIDGALAEKNNSIDTAPNLTDGDKQSVKEQAKKAADSAKTAISNAKTVTDVESAKKTGVENIKNMPIPTASKTKNDANSALDTTAAAAKKAIDKTSGLTADQKQAAKDQIDQAVTAAKDNINKASDDTGVAAATDAGKLAIDKVSANAAIDGALAEKNNSIDTAPNLTDGDKQSVKEQAKKAADNAKSAINTAQDNDAVKKAQTDGVNNINGITVPTDSDVKKNAKEAIDQAAKTKDNAIDASNLTAEEKADLKKKVAGEVKTAKDNIDAATKAAEVKTAQTNGDKAINAVEIPASASKTDAINAINTALAAKKGAINGTNLTDEEKNALINKAQKLADDAIADINKATTNEAVNTAKENGVQAIDAVEIPASASKTDANKAIDAALAKKIEEINNANLTDDQKQSLIDQAQNAANQAKENVRSASTDEDVQTAKNNGIAAINGIPVKSNSVDDQDNSATNEGNGNQAGHIQSDNSSDVTKHSSTQQSGNVIDADKDTIPVKDLIIGVKGEDISGNKHDSNSPSGSNTDDETNGNNVNNAEGMNGNTAKSGSKNNSLKTLPQKGTKDVTILEILGLFLSLFGLLGLKKKHREE